MRSRRPSAARVSLPGVGSLDPIIRRQMAAATDASEAFMDLVLGEAARLAPVEEGTLRASGDRRTIRHADGADVEGFFSTPYAARQHEELGWRHPKGGQAKYLETPFNEASGRYEGIVGAAIRGVT